MDYNPASLPRGNVMHQHKWLRAALMISGMAVALTAQGAAQTPAAQEYQPGQVIKVAAHRSRWDYPKEITLPEGTQLHIVETRDTLWDLGNKYLGNPFSWPQIWEMNQWVTDPHWIYPGDYLVIPSGRTTILPGETPAEVTEVSPGGMKFQVKPQRDEYAFTFQDYLMMPYLAPNGAEAHFKEIGALEITGRQEPMHSELGDFDTIYVDGGSDNGLKIGDRLLGLKVIQTNLYHPSDINQSKSMGAVIKQIAVVRITQVEAKAAVAVIEKSADTLQVGDRLAPFVEPANMALRLRNDIKSPVSIQSPEARIIYVGENHTVSGTGDMVLIDQGTKDGLKVGDVLLSARERTWPVGTGTATGKTNYLIGQLMVVKVNEGSATCRILRAYEEVTAGDLVTR
jgi:LysM domain